MKTKELIFVACAGAAMLIQVEQPKAEPPSVEMPIKVNIIQCGTQKEAIERCITDEPMCCPLISTASGEPEPLNDNDMEGDYE